MLRQVYDPQEMAVIINHPEVLPGSSLGLTDHFDPSPLFDNPLDVFLMDDIGGFMCFYEGDGVYDCHSFFLPEGRGKEALRVAKESIKYMFEVVKAQHLVGWTPVEKRDARMFSRMAGFKAVGIEQHQYGLGEQFYECEKMSLTRGEYHAGNR